jgi:signal transduction histidine kinase
LSQVRRGLTSVNELRARLSAVRSGQSPRVDGDYPGEVQPLVDDLNALLAHREQAVRRAQAKAGDLAHGLKTPLAVLGREAELAEAAGQVELATGIRGEVDRMRRHIDYHLSQARAAASAAAPGAVCLVHTSAAALARTLTRLHAEKGVTIELSVAPDLSVAVERQDLDELLGNLLDNACKWSRGHVELSAVGDGRQVVIAIEDDGDGLCESMWDSVLRRGVRADETAPGSGLGLAIVRDLAALYGGTVSLGRAARGGLRAELRLPA